MASAPAAKPTAEPETRDQTPTSEPSGEPEPENTPTSEPSAGEPEPVAESLVTPAQDILIPTALLCLLIIAGLVFLLVKRRCKSKRIESSPFSLSSASLRSVFPVKVDNEAGTFGSGADDDFLTTEDRKVCKGFHQFYNTAADLASIAAPGLISIVQAPMVLFCYPYLVTLMWPTADTPPNVNDAIACFLTPAGLVYATVFASAFTSASDKLGDLQAKLRDKVTKLDLIYCLTDQIDIPVVKQLGIVKAVKSETINVMSELQGLRKSEPITKGGPKGSSNAWTILGILKSVSLDDTEDLVSQAVIGQLVDLTTELAKDSKDQEHFRGRIHPVKWTFLELLGFFSFFGVALIDTKSSVMSLGICMITVFSISIMSYVIADLDNPFSGFFRLDLSLFDESLQHGRQCYQELKARLTRKEASTQKRHHLAAVISKLKKSMNSISQIMTETRPQEEIWMGDLTGWEWPFAGNVHQRRGWKFSSRLVQAMVFGIAKVSTSWPLNKKRIYNEEKLIQKLESRIAERKQGGTNNRPLITICNHNSCIDDPLVWGAMLRWRDIFSGEMRWIPTAAEFTFHSRWYQWWFGHGRCVPVLRGQGVYQKGMDFCVHLMNENQWMHVFPEGKINLDDTKRLKWGIGRLIVDSNIIPEIIPIWLFGMDDVLPNKKPYIPQVGQTVSIYVGEPLDIEPVVKKLQSETTDPMKLRKGLTDFIQEEFWKLKDHATEQHQKSIQYSPYSNSSTKS